jgi:hypothetical protein
MKGLWRQRGDGGACTVVAAFTSALCATRKSIAADSSLSAAQSSGVKPCARRPWSVKGGSSHAHSMGVRVPVEQQESVRECVKKRAVLRASRW